MLGEPTKRILDAMVWLESGRIPMPWTKSVVAYSSFHLPRSGAFKGCISKLYMLHLVNYLRGGIVLEHEGRELARVPSAEQAFSGIGYWERVSQKLSPIEQAICLVLRESDVAIAKEALRAMVTEGLYCGSNTAERDFRHATAKLLAVDLISVKGGAFTATRSLVPLSIFELRELRAKKAKR